MSNPFDKRFGLGKPGRWGRCRECGRHYKHDEPRFFDNNEPNTDDRGPLCRSCTLHRAEAAKIKIPQKWSKSYKPQDFAALHAETIHNELMSFFGQENHAENQENSPIKNHPAVIQIALPADFYDHLKQTIVDALMETSKPKPSKPRQPKTIPEDNSWTV